MFSNHDEATEVTSFFRNAFEKYKTKPIVLYGLGINTKALIHNLKDFNIIGVMDAKHEGETFEELPVFSEKEAIKVTNIIIIVARAAVVPLIYNRIKHLEESGLSIYNIAGINLNKAQNMYRGFPEPISQTTLKEAILEHEIICFDIFDTLIARKIVRPEELFEIVEKRLRKKGYNIDFCKLRQNASMLAYQKKVSPTLEDIYEEMASMGNIESEKLAEFMQEELETELDYVSPRESVISLLKYSQEHGKKIYLISDMYLRSPHMVTLLEKCGVKEYDSLIISCEYSKSKWPTGELFDVVKNKNPSHISILHFGDNEGADIECALNRGLDAIKIPSNYEIMLHSPFQTLLSFNRNLGDSIAIGIFQCRYLSDPFKDYSTLRLEKGDIGFVCYAALIVGYLAWIIKICRQSNISHIAFIARDGWILNKVWEIMKQAFPFERLPRNNYILGSRRALAIPAIKNMEDIKEALQKVPDSMDSCKMLSSRFGIEETKIRKEEGKIDCVFNRANEILKNAQKERSLYNEYIDGIIEQGERVAVVDAVSSGTIGKYFFQATQREGIFLCMLHSNVPNYSVYDEIESYAYMGKDSKYAPKRSIHKHIGEFEGVLTAPAPMFLHFDKHGKAQYASLCLDKGSIKTLNEVHEGIFEYTQEIYQLIPDLEILEFTPELCDTFFGLYYEDNFCTAPEVKETLREVDDF